MAAFEELGIMAEICAGLEEMDWLLPTDVQQEAVPLILGGLKFSTNSCVCVCQFIRPYNRTFVCELCAYDLS